MNFAAINLFQLMGVKMDYDNQRQSVLARNMANIDTPGFRSEDLKKLDFGSLANAEASRLDLRATSPMHFNQGKKAKQGPYKVEQTRKTFETTPVENSVVLEEQMMKVAQNQMDYQMTTQLYRKMVDIFKITISTR